MKNILVVEDSPMVMKIIKHVLSQSSLINVAYAVSFAEARTHVENAKEPFFAALVDLSLPDAPSGEVVDYTLVQSIPTIVLTSTFDEKKREIMLSKGIVDYVTKEGRYSYQLALNTVHRLIKNETVKVLVVDDSSTQRNMLVSLLRLHMYQVLEATDGIEAIKTILANPDIKMLITDFNMPRMDGFELIKNLRIKYEKSDLVIIGLASDSTVSLSAKFIKYGANDFLHKPFNHEEFFCRITHNIEFLELIEQIRDKVSRDELTGVFHRQYFFKAGGSMHAQALEQKSPLAAVAIDLNHFGDINQEHGNDVGDELMRMVAQRLDTVFDRFLLARAEGQEYFVLMPGLDNDKACAYVEKVRQMIGVEDFDVDGNVLRMTFTAGVSNKLCETLDEQMLEAVSCLRRAKDTGGDIVIGD